MSQPKFLLDENVDPRLRSALRSNWPSIEVWLVGDPGVPPHGTLDPDILKWCEAYEFILVTNNRASMPVHLAEHLATGGHVPGIIVLNSNLTFGETIELLAVVWGASEPGEYLDRIYFLPSS